MLTNRLGKHATLFGEFTFNLFEIIRPKFYFYFSHKI